MPGTPVPFRFIDTLDAKAQKQIERNFQHIVGQLGAAPHNGNTYFIACSNALAWEKSVADLVLTGSADNVAIQTLIDAHPSGSFKFSTGRVYASGSIAPWAGQKFEGTAYEDALNGAHFTAWQCSGASSGYAGGPSFPIAIDYNHAGAGGIGPPAAVSGDFGGAWKYFEFYNHTITGATETSVFQIVDLNAYFMYFGWLQLLNESGSGSWTNLFIAGTNSNLPFSVFENLSAPGTTNFNHSSTHSFIIDSVLINIRGFAPQGTQSDLFFRNVFIKTFYDNVAPVNSNIIWPQSGLPPTGAASGDLAGTYPAPTIGTNKVTNAQLAQGAANTLKGNNTAGVANEADLTVAQVKTLLGFIATGDTAGGDLTGTYVNPTVKGVSGASLDIIISTIGKGFRTKEGTNAKQGVATMAAGTVTVANTSVTANSRIFLTVQTLGTVTVPKAVAVTATVVGTSFTITSSDATDTSVVAWEIFEPG